jgi:hypothetical protein
MITGNVYMVMRKLQFTIARPERFSSPGVREVAFAILPARESLLLVPVLVRRSASTS